MEGRTLQLNVYRSLDGRVHVGVKEKHTSVSGDTLRKALAAAADLIQPSHDN